MTLLKFEDVAARNADKDGWMDGISTNDLYC